jgi:hypothetical protein
MAKISENSPLYRTKQVIANDLAFILNAKNLHRGTQQAVIDNILWVWSEFDGKYKGCKYWSAKALSSVNKPKKLIHEHLVPRKMLREMIFDLNNPSSDELYKILDTWCIGVVVTVDEDRNLNKLKLRSSMPQNWDKENKWSRYIEAGIKISAEPTI